VLGAGCQPRSDVALDSPALRAVEIETLLRGVLELVPLGEGLGVVRGDQQAGDELVDVAILPVTPLSLCSSGISRTISRVADGSAVTAARVLSSSRYHPLQVRVVVAGVPGGEVNELPERRRPVHGRSAPGTRRGGGSAGRGKLGRGLRDGAPQHGRRSHGFQARTTRPARATISRSFPGTRWHTTACGRTGRHGMPHASGSNRYLRSATANREGHPA
jgi:hypothetical protein